MSAEDLDKGPIGHRVRKAETAEVTGISESLAGAFEDDPVMSWLIPDAGRRPAVLKGFFELLLSRIWMLHEETYTTTATAGAAIWDPPGTWSVGVGEQIALLPRALRIWGRRLPRALLTLARLEAAHPKAGHFYLAVLGVDPESQGRGLGSALMFPVLQRCDAERIPAYLEASAPRNRDLYLRHGFEVTREFRVGSGAPPIWGMWREPS